MKISSSWLVVGAVGALATATIIVANASTSDPDTTGDTVVVDTRTGQGSETTVPAGTQDSPTPSPTQIASPISANTPAPAPVQTTRPTPAQTVAPVAPAPAPRPVANSPVSPASPISAPSVDSGD